MFLLVYNNSQHADARLTLSVYGVCADGKEVLSNKYFKCKGSIFIEK